VLAEQVVQLVVAGRGLGEQMLVIQLIEAATGFLQTSAVQRGGGVGVDARPGDQAEPAEQPLLADGEVLVGQVERGGNREVLGVHQGETVSSLRQAGGQPGWGPGGVVAQLGGEHPYRQRQITTEPRDLPHGRVPGP
jgi:hypothetical protein